MKNIFLISTDKPSRLHMTEVQYGKYDHLNPEFNSYKLKFLLYPKPKGSGKNIFARNIYITNTEKILVNNYVFNTFNNTIYKIVSADSKRDMLCKSDSILMCEVEAFPKQYFKVCLTNDTSLIGDGVQEVSSSFLSFYAKNPVDCVEVEKNTFWVDSGVYDQPDKLESSYSLNFMQKETENKENWIFERSSGYAGYRNILTDEWIYEREYLEKTEEKLYTKEEVIEIIKKYNNDNNTLFFDTDKKDVLNNWIENNL